IEPEGITKFCARKVRMNRPTTSTEQMLAAASKGVSSTGFSLGAGSGSDGVLGGGVFLLIILSLCAQMAGGYATVPRFASVNDMEDALPTCERCEACREFPVVSESIIRGLLHIGGRRPAQREVDDQRAGHDGLPRHQAPEAGILAVIAVIAENKVLVLWNHELAMLRKTLKLPPPRRIDVGIRVNRARKIVAER